MHRTPAGSSCEAGQMFCSKQSFKLLNSYIRGLSDYEVPTTPTFQFFQRGIPWPINHHALLWFLSCACIPLIASIHFSFFCKKRQETCLFASYRTPALKKHVLCGAHWLLKRRSDSTDHLWTAAEILAANEKRELLSEAFSVWKQAAHAHVRACPFARSTFRPNKHACACALHMRNIVHGGVLAFYHLNIATELKSTQISNSLLNFFFLNAHSGGHCCRTSSISSLWYNWRQGLSRCVYKQISFCCMSWRLGIRRVGIYMCMHALMQLCICMCICTYVRTYTYAYI